MIVSAAWILPATFAVVNRIAQARLQGWEPATVRDLLFEFGDWLLYALLTPGVFAISRRWPLGWIFITLPFGTAVYLCVVGIEHATRYFIEAREREVQIARLSGQLFSARFAALQAQLNPHFLFNTLNTITVLVRDNDRSGAVRIIESLSEMLRRTLTRHQANEVMLGEELELVRQYVAIEQARFSDRLRPEIRIPNSLLSAAIPSFALQQLVENAIRHGIAKSTEAGHLRINAERVGDFLELRVIDDGEGVDLNAAMPPGHGIENTRERGASYCNSAG